VRLIIVILILFPCLAFAQATTEDYGIYSQYLKELQIERGQINFVIRKSTNYGGNYDDFAANIAGDIRKFLKGDEESRAYFEHVFQKFTPTLIKDTLWVSLLAELNQKIKQKFEMENNFSPDLNTVVINTHIYKRYFRHFKGFKRIEKCWIHFHKKYPKPAAMVEFSEIASDGQRAVFYFTMRCNPLCGEGDLVFFHKENNEWKYLYSAPLWFN